MPWNSMDRKHSVRAGELMKRKTFPSTLPDDCVIAPPPHMERMFHIEANKFHEYGQHRGRRELLAEVLFRTPIFKGGILAIDDT